jgi:hypothetical protein
MKKSRVLVYFIDKNKFMLLYLSLGTFLITSVLLSPWHETKSIKKYGRELTFSRYIEVIMAQKFANRFPCLGLGQNEPKQK